jgi:photosystem II stability/assembly factor-like uncharacterized protein
MRLTRALPLAALAASSLAGAQAPAAAPAGSPRVVGARGSDPRMDSITFAGLRWRQIGPANMMGRVTDVEGIPSPSRTFYFAAAAGGIWKTTNGGVTFRPVFDNAGRVISMGDLAIAPSDTNQVWAGTGEEDSRNSISPGQGIYKSTDGGKSWTLMGLEKTQHIGRIVVHPSNPDVVWVAALGAAWAQNPERGLYKTTDGGKSWRKVLSVPGRESIAGAVDVAIHPRDPNTLWAATWERIRGPYFLRSGGPGSGLWKSTDGGETWARVQGNGLPTTTLGRIGIDISQSNPDYIYLMVEADTAPNATKGGRPATRPSGLYRTTDGGRTWERRAPQNVRPFYYSQVRVDPTNPERVFWSSTPVNYSTDGGKTVRTATNGLHVDHHAMWIDPRDPAHMIVGNDGGIGITWDGGGNYTFPNVVALGQFYNISFDMQVPYRVCGGLQDNGSWCGPSRRRSGDITNAMWATVNGGDGFVTQQDPTDPDIIYATSQGGNMARINWRTGERVGLQKPSWRPRYLQWEDSIIVARGDTTRPAPRETERRIAEMRRQQREDSVNLDIRWNWNTPFFLSPHNPSVFYAGANRVMKSTKRGDDLRPISPDLSKREMAKIDTSMRKTGGITPDATGAETYGTVVSLNESPVRPGILWAGTDDGNVWLTRNDGATWEQIPTARFAGLPAEGAYVSRIEPSRYDSATVYVTFTNHRRNDFTPYVYTSTDWGRTFRSIAGGLPTGGHADFVHVIREDPVNRDLLYVGTDIGVYVSLDRGASWQRFANGLPNVPVHDLLIHPRDRELIAGTHGRSIWIVDVAPLQQMTPQAVAANVHLFAPRTAFQYGQSYMEGHSTGHQVFAAPSPQYGADITYRIAKTANRASIVITDAAGDTVRTLPAPTRAGLHRVVWNFQGRPAAAAPLTPSQRRDSVNQARRTEFVLDSAQKAGVPAALIGRLRTFARQAGGGGGGGGGGFGGGGGGGGVRPDFVERPGEGRAGGGGGGGGFAAAFGGLDAEDLETAQELLRAVRGGGGGGGGFGFRAPPLVNTGDYLVTLDVDGQKFRQPLRVERLATSDGLYIAAELEELGLLESEEPEEEGREP